MMHDSMQYDPIQGQGQGHVTSTVGNSTILKVYLPPNYDEGWQMTTDS